MILGTHVSKQQYMFTISRIWGHKSVNNNTCLQYLEFGDTSR